MDTVYADHGLELPGFLKIDTQGGELDILNGAEALLQTVSMVDVEVELTRIYRGQPTAHDVLRYMD